MSFLVRVQLPDEPGSLGALAEAFGTVQGNIQSVDIVAVSTDGFVIDDIVIELPPPAMADTLITAATSLPGVDVDSIRPFSGRVDRRGQIDMLAALASQTAARRGGRTLDELVATLPQTMTASWAILLDNTTGNVRRHAASVAAPEEDGSTPVSIDISAPRILNPEAEDWIPHSWAVLDTALAAAPLTGTGLVVVIGRVGGPDFLSVEVEHLGNVAMIIGGLLASTGSSA